MSLCIDLFCGLGGWAEGFLAEGWDVVGFDIERHDYGTCGYPGTLVLQDVLTLDGRQFRNADCIAASPPCQRYSYMAMPWGRAKREVRWQEWERDSPFGDRLESLNALFAACFRIQREASEAAGRHIPMVVENVNGAQRWIGKARANFGSFYFWGDIGMVGNQVVAGRMRLGDTVAAARRNGKKVDGFNFHQFEKTGGSGGSFQTASVLQMEGIKQRGSGAEWFDTGIAALPSGSRGRKGTGRKLSDVGFNVANAQRLREEFGWSKDSPLRNNSSKSDSRKAASAQIAKIPFPLASYIARQFKSK